MSLRTAFVPIALAGFTAAEPAKTDQLAYQLIETNADEGKYLVFNRRNGCVAEIESPAEKFSFDEGLWWEAQTQYSMWTCPKKVEDMKKKNEKS